jgi:hypothetical protein
LPDASAPSSAASILVGVFCYSITDPVFLISGMATCFQPRFFCSPL